MRSQSDIAACIVEQQKAATSAHANVLIVGDNESATKYVDLFGTEKLIVKTAESVADALFELRGDTTIDLIMVDAASDRLDALELSRRIKYDDTHRLLPIIVVLGSRRAEDRLEVLRAGADDCLTAPFQTGELLQRCRNLIRNKQAADVLENSEKVIYSLARITEGRDKYTQGHVERVAAYSVEIGNRLGLCDDDIAALNKGGVVHDLGKVAVPDAILNKEGGLDPHEWHIMKQHPVIGFDVLARLRTFHDVLPIVRWHHEKPNGRGYPDGIGGDELPLLPRIVSVADCFDAVTTVRSYHCALPPDSALDILARGAECNDYDADAAAAMIELVRNAQGV